MNAKTFVWAGITVFFCVALTLFIVNKYQPNQQMETEELLFAKSYDHAMNINKIIITDSSSEKTLLLDGKYWRIPQADNYYAGVLITNALLYSINTAKTETIVHNITPEMQVETPQVGVNKPGSNGTKISTYDKENNLIESIIIGSSKNNLQYAKRIGKNYAMMISGNFDLPKNLMSWLQQPLLQISPDAIETLILQSETGQQMAFRVQEGEPFQNVNRKPTNITDLLKPLSNLKIAGVTDYEVSGFKYTDPKRVISLFMFSGMIYTIEIYEKNNEYWTRINLSSTTLPTKLASDYIKNNSFLYRGWIFKINPNVGALLSEYNIY